MRVLSILILCSTMSISSVWASDYNEAKIKTVAAMYQQDIKAQYGLDTLAKFAGGPLQKALKKQRDYSAKHGELCGVDYDPLWQSQDPNYQARLQYSLVNNGQVKVTIGRQGSVIYALDCKDKRCKITDVFSNGSVVNSINNECS